MVAWAKRFYPKDDWPQWANLKDRFTVDFMNLGSPREMMLVIVSDFDADGDTVIMSLPKGIPLARYPGFKEMPVDELPKTAKPLVENGSRFSEFFQPQLYD